MSPVSVEARAHVMQKMGERMAAEVLRSARKIGPASPVRYPIQYTVTLVSDWPLVVA